MTGMISWSILDKGNCFWSRKSLLNFATGGFDMRSKKLLLFVFLALILTGCNNKPIASQTDSSQQNPESTQKRIDVLDKDSNNLDKNSSINLESWIGDYKFSEFAPPDENMFYSISIYKANNEYYAKISIDGFQTIKRMQAKISGDQNSIELIFDKYLPDNRFEPYQAGDLLISFKLENSTLYTIWGKIQPMIKSNNKAGEMYFKNVLKTTVIGTTQQTATTQQIPSPPSISSATDTKKSETKDTLPKYYDYTGGKLPDNIITPLEYTVSNKINISKPEFIFEVYGSNVKSYGLTSDKTKYYIARDSIKVTRIVIMCNDISYKQELLFPETNIPNIPECTYGFSLDDWNFDGFLDISLWMHEGGTSLNSPHYYWLWDDNENCYIRNQDLEDINGNTYMDIDKQNRQIVAAERRSDGYFHGYYKWQAGEIVLVKTEDLEYVVPIDNKTEKAKGHYIIKELINGKMQITNEYYKD